jgi:hypothetical protein
LRRERREEETIMNSPPSHSPLEDRLRAVEDTLAIYHLIASHPPAADTGTETYYRNAFMPDGEVDLGTKTASGNENIGAVVRAPAHQAAIAAGRRQRSGDFLFAGAHAQPRS